MISKYNIKYTKTYKREIEKVIKYIAVKLKNKKAAINLMIQIEKEIISRSYNPKNYNSFKLKNNGKYIWYRINIKNYCSFYTVKDNTMIMRRFLYLKRNFIVLF